MLLAKLSHFFSSLLKTSDLQQWGLGRAASGKQGSFKEADTFLHLITDVFNEMAFLPLGCMLLTSACHSYMCFEGRRNT